MANKKYVSNINVDGVTYTVESGATQDVDILIGDHEVAPLSDAA